ncbi:putative CRISPR-associated protein [Gammaproteobacteria bacterium]
MAKNNMPHLVISTCGTSILTCGVDSRLRGLLTRWANSKRREDILLDSERKTIEEHLECRRSLIKEFIQENNITELTKYSAELNGVASYYDGGRFPNRKDHHILICTDTWLGEESAKLVELFLTWKSFTTQVHRITDLTTGDLSSFRIALSSLVRWCDQTLRYYSQSSYRIIFNLTGGFKSVQGFMQTLAMLYADESIYIFEGSKELLRLPRLPIRMDAEEIVRNHLRAFRRLAEALPTTPEEIHDIDALFLFRIDDDTVLSEWGELVWVHTKPILYKEKIFDPPSKFIRYGTEFFRSVEDLSGERKKIINERIDALSKQLEYEAKGDTHSRLASTDLKKLKNPDRFTHEVDAWADGGAKRLFCNFEDSQKHRVLIIEELGKHL